MSKFRTFVVSLLLVLGIGLVSPSAMAVDLFPGGNESPCEKAGNAPEVCKDADAQIADGGNPIFGPKGLLTKGVQMLVFVVGIISVIMIMISGVRFITSGGDTKTATSARNGIIYSCMGIVVVVIAQLIVTFILSKL